ncbi:MAG: SpoIID/LytB domain-containing protein [Gammaproteobacteria bacterium]|nr:SpoIID/LytB domain-containing protein [Gammaproteobacteria bacterium]
MPSTGWIQMMLEPRPKTINVGQLENDVIRIGIVLAADQQSEIQVSLKGQGYRIGDETLLALDNDYQIEVSDGQVILLSGSTIVEVGEKIVIEPTKSNPPTVGQGVELNSVIAGRGFHWQKPITAIYPGAMEFSVVDNSLVCVNSLSFEDYVVCVAVAEMSPTAPVEFIKAQTIVARSWSRCFLGDKHSNENFDLCNDDECQRYQGVTFASESAISAADETCGEYLIFDHEIVAAYYSKCCGGISADPKGTFGFSVLGVKSVLDGTPAIDAGDIETWVSIKESDAKQIHCSGLQLADATVTGLIGEVDKQGDYFRWLCEVPKNTVANNLKIKSGISDVAKVISIRPGYRGPSGRLHEVEVIYLSKNNKEKSHHVKNQYDIRSLLHENFLYSSAITIEDKDDYFEFHGAGWGHGVGLCQLGAVFQALKGVSYQKILECYFPDARLVKAY